MAGTNVHLSSSPALAQSPLMDLVTVMPKQVLRLPGSIIVPGGPRFKPQGPPQPSPAPPGSPVPFSAPASPSASDPASSGVSIPSEPISPFPGGNSSLGEGGDAGNESGSGGGFAGWKVAVIVSLVLSSMIAMVALCVVVLVRHRKRMSGDELKADSPPSSQLCFKTVSQCHIGCAAPALATVPGRSFNAPGMPNLSPISWPAEPSFTLCLLMLACSLVLNHAPKPPHAPMHPCTTTTPRPAPAVKEPPPWTAAAKPSHTLTHHTSPRPQHLASPGPAWCCATPTAQTQTAQT